MIKRFIIGAVAFVVLASAAISADARPRGCHYVQGNYWCD
jgi:opacity protein-like surface antigen